MELIDLSHVSLAENAGLEQDKNDIGGYRRMPAEEPAHDRVQRDARRAIGRVNQQAGDEAQSVDERGPA